MAKSTTSESGYSFQDAAGSIATGEGIVATVRAATTANVANLAAGAPEPVDGINLAVGDLILVKNQAAAATNGIYTVDTVGGGANGVWTRTPLFASAAGLEALSLIWVRSGTVNAETLWGNTTDPVITVGGTAITFVQQGTLPFLTMWVGPGTARTVNEYTILVGDVVPHDINASGGAVELNLPTAAAWIAANPEIPFIRISAVNIANAATVDPNGAETINGAALYTFATAWDSIDLYPISGTGWVIR
jgi:hypothetical protein